MLRQINLSEKSYECKLKQEEEINKYLGYKI